MTTTVKVMAHCSSDKQVSVNISSDSGAENHVLQDGEEAEYYAYDDRVISVKEVVKTA